jgi:arsenate reductase
MNDKVVNVLFLCTGNSARSILAESILNQEGQNRFRGYSAGSHPTGRVHPLARALLERRNLPTDKLRSKNWEEFAGPDSPEIDFVITVCDNAAGEVCPIFRGNPLSAHWGLPDPAAVQGSSTEQAIAFAATFQSLSDRIRRLIDLPIHTLDASALQNRLNEIGKED